MENLTFFYEIAALFNVTLAMIFRIDPPKPKTCSFFLIVAESLAIIALFKSGLYILSIGISYYLMMDFYEMLERMFGLRKRKVTPYYSMDETTTKVLKELAYIFMLVFIAITIGKCLSHCIQSDTWPLEMAKPQHPYTQGLATTFMTVPHVVAVRGRPSRFIYVNLGFLLAGISCLYEGLYFLPCLMFSVNLYYIKYIYDKYINISYYGGFGDENRYRRSWSN